MASEDKLVFEGVIESFAKDVFLIRVSDDFVAQCSLGGKLRMSGIKLSVGDKVRIETSPYDPRKGRIVFRLK